MLQTIYASKESDTDFISLATELLEKNLRTLVITISTAYLIWFLIAGALQPDQVTINASPLTIVIIITSVLTLVILRNKVLLAQIIWLVGLAVAIIVSLYLFQ